jgi:purine-nucleoside phosphorylase
MIHSYDNIVATVEFIKSKTTSRPTVGVILGSGLGGLIDALKIDTEIHYKDIPHFPVSTVQGHAGNMAFGTLGGKEVVMMAGRFHYYEGYDMEEVTFPVRVMKLLGVETLFLSNAAGGMNPEYNVGDIMLINDHINLFPEHPLRGPNEERFGTRFPDMSEPYSHKLISLAQNISAEQKLKVHTGVYIGLQGPTFETPAEYKWLRIIGGDAVGMSTVPENIVAKHCGMNVFAASIITDLGIIGIVHKISHEEVLAAANAAAPKLATLVSAIIEKM